MSEEDHLQARVNPEMLVGVSAVIIGICALGISLYETSLMREEQRAAVMPLLELSRSYSLSDEGAETKTPRLWLQAENVGIGPARVEDFRVTVDGRPLPTWDAAIRELTGQDSAVAYGQSTINGRTIPAERLVTMMDLEDGDLTERVLLEFDRLDFEACYCSIFDECWTTSYSAFGATTKVDTCERSDSSFVE